MLPCVFAQGIAFVLLHSFHFWHMYKQLLKQSEMKDASANTSAGRLSFTESDFDRGISNYHPSGKLCNYIIPIPGFPAGAAGIGSLIVATAASVVRKLLATLVAF